VYPFSQYVVVILLTTPLYSSFDAAHRGKCQRRRRFRFSTAAVNIGEDRKDESKHLDLGGEFEVAE
jgi:hypothetical protein